VSTIAFPLTARAARWTRVWRAAEHASGWMAEILAVPIAVLPFGDVADVFVSRCCITALVLATTAVVTAHVCAHLSFRAEVAAHDERAAFDARRLELARHRGTYR